MGRSDRPPYLAEATSTTPAGWYTVPDGRELWWSGMEWVVVPPHSGGLPGDAPTRLITTTPKRTSHTFHLIMTLLTCGFWAPVWLATAVVNSLSTDRNVTRIG